MICLQYIQPLLKKSWDSETQINPLLPAITIITSASQGQATQGRGEQHLHRLGLWPYQESTTHENIEHHNFYGVYWIIEYVNNWWSFYDGSDLILMFACCHWPHSAMPSACVRDLQAASLRDPRQPPTEASPGQPFQLLIAYKDTHWMPQSVEHENPANSANLYMLHLPLVAHLPFFTCSNMASLLARCWLGVGHIASQKRILLIQNDCIDVHCPTHRISSWEWVISLEVNPCKSACSSAVVERNVVHNIAQSNMGIHGEVKSSKAGDK